MAVGSLLVVSGPPGAGKSTLATAIARELDRSAVVDGDVFFRFLASGRLGPWLPESNEQNSVVIQAAAAATGRFVNAEEKGDLSYGA